MSRRNVLGVIGAVVALWVLISILAVTGLHGWESGLIVDGAIFLVVLLMSRKAGQRFTPDVLVVIGVPIAAILIALFLPSPTSYVVGLAALAWYAIGATYLNKIGRQRRAAKAQAPTNSDELESCSAVRPHASENVPPQRP